MKKKKKEKSFVKIPFFKGGKDSLQQFVRTNLNYPTKALEAEIEGTVFIKYSIDYKGNVVEAKTLKGLGYGCDEEAIRIVKLLKFETFKIRKIKIRYHKEIKIHFKLPKQKKENTKVNFNYNYSPSSQKNSFSYIVNI